MAESIWDRASRWLGDSLGGRPRNPVQLPHHPRVSYRESGRAGAVFFQNDVTSFELYWEFGGGQTVALIYVPDEANWASATRLPLDQREGVLRFIAEQILIDKTSGNCRYEIDAASISIVQ